MTDNGLAALAEALRDTTYNTAATEGAMAEWARELLGGRGVFLPDGLSDDRIGLLANMNRLAEANADYGAEIDRQAATIAALRTALDGLVAALTNPTPQPGDLGRALLAARAALATAKEAGG
jgi:hypothetical protein